GLSLVVFSSDEGNFSYSKGGAALAVAKRHYDRCGELPKRRFILFGDYISTCKNYITANLYMLNKVKNKMSFFSNRVLKINEKYMLHLRVRNKDFNSITVSYYKKEGNHYKLKFETSDNLDFKKYCIKNPKEVVCDYYEDFD
ncbi:hypothetical protein, partial [Bacteriovorax sp. DB6_IX]|uniref:hypothetical protein n=1 Tax=Bacteriovorax sp. DB6_IX TaxID=1353530 RepID=UPI000555D108